MRHKGTTFCKLLGLLVLALQHALHMLIEKAR